MFLFFCNSYINDLIARAISKTPPKISMPFELNFFKQKPLENPKNEFINVTIPIVTALNNNGVFVNDNVIPAENASILVAIPSSKSVLSVNIAFSSFSLLKASLIIVNPRYAKIINTIHFE